MTNDYIRREDAITAACKSFCYPGVRCPDEPCREQTKYLRELPPADVVQVVYGRWIDADSHLGYFANCSACGYQMDVHAERGYFNFCPNCGAKMDRGW